MNKNIVKEDNMMAKDKVSLVTASSRGIGLAHMCADTC